MPKKYDNEKYSWMDYEEKSFTLLESTAAIGFVLLIVALALIFA